MMKEKSEMMIFFQIGTEKTVGEYPGATSRKYGWWVGDAFIPTLTEPGYMPSMLLDGEGALVMVVP
jgi:hypothetical protein